MFTLEIAGIAVATTDADEEQARAIFESEDFLDDIRGFTVGGKPLWDGKAALTVRPANEEEAEAFSEIDDIEFEDDEEDDDEEFDEDGASIMFLVDVDQLNVDV